MLSWVGMCFYYSLTQNLSICEKRTIIKTKVMNEAWQLLYLVCSFVN